MRPYLCCGLALLHVCVVAASNFQGALDEILSHHSKDATALRRTLDSLTHIATRLQWEPENPKYRNIRLLNKTFWERVGSVNGGISFMSALGFDLLGQGTASGPCFQIRVGAPVEKDLEEALNLLSARGVQLEQLATVQQTKWDAAAPPPTSCSSFNPFATTFSRKARTRLQERAERGLAHLSESQARWQQRFFKLEERNITIMLPQARSQQPQGASTLSFGDSIETKEDEEDEERREVELVAQLWREKMSKDEGMRFETSAARKLRLLRTAKVYPYVLLRIRLPGGMFIQARFSAQESLETVYQVIEEILSEEAGDGDFSKRNCHNFELFVAPPTQVLQRDGTSLKESNLLAPACVLHLRWQSEHAQVEGWAQSLEEIMSRATGGSSHPRLPYSSRYDVPKPISSQRPQDLHAAEGPDDSRLEFESEPMESHSARS
ncbi:unnamed protein product [Pylaiella littoralis]